MNNVLVCDQKRYHSNAPNAYMREVQSRRNRASGRCWWSSGSRTHTLQDHSDLIHSLWEVFYKSVLYPQDIPRDVHETVDMDWKYENNLALHLLHRFSGARKPHK